MPRVATPSRLDQILEEHRELRELTGGLREFLARPRPDPGVAGAHRWSATLSRTLIDLHDRLFRHFRHEEEGGVVEEMTAAHPRSAEKIQAVFGEHPEMLRDARRITDDVLRYSEGRKPEDPKLRSRISELLDQLEGHERAETDLVQRLEYRDNGVGD